MKKDGTHPLCFVFGALRSGTTMFRLMLNNHPDLFSPGEADFLFDYLNPNETHPSGWRYDIEGLLKNRIFRAHNLNIPQNCDGVDLLVDFLDQLQGQGTGMLILNVHRHARKIATLQPDAKFIHLIRDGRDVAFSSIGMGWAGNSYYGVDHWIETEAVWDQLAARIPSSQRATLKFENLMGDIETELSRICDFLEIPFDPVILEYHRNSSYAPPNPAIAQQWKRRASARNISLIEGKCADLLQARGYTLNGKAIVPNAFERAWLFCTHRVNRWRFNIRRFGIGFFLKSRLMQLVGTQQIRDRVRLQQDAKITKLLK